MFRVQNAGRNLEVDLSEVEFGNGPVVGAPSSCPENARIPACGVLAHTIEATNTASRREQTLMHLTLLRFLSQIVTLSTGESILLKVRHFSVIDHIASAVVAVPVPVQKTGLRPQDFMAAPLPRFLIVVGHQKT